MYRHTDQLHVKSQEFVSVWLAQYLSLPMCSRLSTMFRIFFSHVRSPQCNALLQKIQRNFRSPRVQVKFGCLPENGIDNSP